MKLSDYVIERIVAEGVKHLFFVPGGAAMHLNDSLGHCEGIEYVSNLHEQAAAFAAETYAKMTGGLGVAMVTAGPGVTNAMTGLAGAWLDSTPCLFLSGQVKSADLKGDSGLRQKGVQEIGAIDLVSSITKYAVTVTDPVTIRFHLEKALHLSRSGRPGPVWLDIPMDVQAAQIEPEELEGFISDDVAGANGSCSIDSELLEQVRQVIQLLNQSRRPLILAGNGVRLAKAQSDFEKLIELLNIPVQLTWLSVDMLDYEHPLYAGRPGSAAARGDNFIIQNCDLLICLGTRLDNTITGFAPQNLAREAKKILVEVDPAEIEKFGEVIDLPICANVSDFIIGLLGQKDDIALEPRNEWWSRCREWREKYPVVLPEHRDPEEPISIFHFAEAMNQVSNGEDLIVSGSSGIGIEVFQLAYRMKKGQRLFHTTALGSMGNALPAVIGACLGSGRRRTICVDGDGGFFFNVQELATIANLGLPAKIFLFNNNGYSSIRATQVGYFQGNLVGCDGDSGLKLPDVLQVAQAFGLSTARISEVEDLAVQITTVLEMPGPVVCEVMVRPDETRAPRIATTQNAEGKMVSKALEDLWPFLDREEFLANMIVAPLDN